MNFNQIALELARERQEQLIAEMAHSRRIQPSRRPSIRRSIGRRFVAMGAWIAAESPLELARSR
jgi:hypothetical protein